MKTIVGMNPRGKGVEVPTYPILGLRYRSFQRETAMHEFPCPQAAERTPVAVAAAVGTHPVLGVQVKWPPGSLILSICPLWKTAFGGDLVVQQPPWFLKTGVVKLHTAVQWREGGRGTRGHGEKKSRRQKIGFFY